MRIHVQFMFVFIVCKRSAWRVTDIKQGRRWICTVRVHITAGAWSIVFNYHNAPCRLLHRRMWLTLATVTENYQVSTRGARGQRWRSAENERVYGNRRAMRLRNLQFTTPFKDDSSELAELKQSKYHKRWYYFAAHRQNVTVCEVGPLISSFVIFALF